MEQNKKTVSPMSNEGRNAYVVEQLTAALLELLKEKPLEEISVSQLCGRAGVPWPFPFISSILEIIPSRTAA